MRSRGHHEEHDNHERWLVSYADFITLLFAFFVVMYAISSVNEGKYRVLSDTLDATFRATPRSSSIINIGEPARSPVKIPGSTQPGAELTVPETKATLTDDTQNQGEPREFIKQPQAVAQKVRTSLAALLTKGVVVMRTGGQWVEVELKSQILFDSGDAALKKEALPVLRSVAHAIAPMANRVQVEGYTDNTPINTPAFPSNWELSAARAASVVQLFTRSGVDASRLAAVGYADQRPKAGNDTPQGRQQNRRIVVRISTVDDPNRPDASTTPAGAGATGGADRNAGSPPADSAAVDGSGQKVDFSKQPGAAAEVDSESDVTATKDEKPAVESAANRTAASPGDAEKAANAAAAQQKDGADKQAPAGAMEWIRTPPQPEGLDLN